MLILAPPKNSLCVIWQILACTLLISACFLSAPRRVHAETCEAEKLRVEAADPGTTVVCEDRPKGGGVDTGPASSDNGGSTETTTHRPTGGGGGGRPRPQQHNTPDVLDFHDFEFKDENSVSQKTKCIQINFGPPGFAPVPIVFVVHVPKKISSGRVISALEAQTIAHGLAQAAALTIIDRVNEGTLDPIYMKNAFLAELTAVYKKQQLGITINTSCKPT